MRNYINFIFLFTMSSLIGCTSYSITESERKQAIANVDANFSQSAITINISTDTDLNSLQGIANSCTLLVIQAQNVSTLNKLLSTPFALKNLFNSAGTQNEILKVDRYSAMPGQRATLHIDRNQNTHYIAFVAGYYPFPEKQHMAIFAIPVKTEKLGFWNPKWGAQLDPLTLHLRLGSDSISQIEGSKQELISFTDNKII